MSIADAPVNSSENSDVLREEWIGRLSALMKDLRLWATELGWSAKEVPKRLQDSEFGTYEAWGLVLQKEFVKVLMDPIARSASGVQGVVDFYLMPGLDDIASLYFYDGRWNLHHPFHDPRNVATPREADPRPLTRESFGETLRGMAENAV